MSSCQNILIAAPDRHHSCDLEVLFEACFFSIYNTRLCGGGEEPLYLPADRTNPYHRLIFREDYFASALHEVAHWCIAGGARRELRDFGYWYVPDGRDAEQQRDFEQMELKPQALEWIFAEAAGISFQVSTDNLSGLEACAEEDHQALLVFRARVWKQVAEYCQRGLPPRAAIFVQALTDAYGSGKVLDISRYNQE